MLPLARSAAPFLALAVAFSAMAVPARAQDETAPAAKTRTSCDFYGRCFEFAGSNDLLASASGNLWRFDPLALANGKPGESFAEGLADDD